MSVSSSSMEQLSPEVVALLLEHHRRFREFLERRIGSRAAAEELLQAAFVKSLEKAASSATVRAR